MDEKVTKLYDYFRILSLQMKPVSWDVMPDVTSWVETWTQVR